MHEGAAVMNTDSGELVPRDGETQGEIVLAGQRGDEGVLQGSHATRAARMMAGSSLAMPPSGMIMATSRSGQAKAVISRVARISRRLRLRDISIGTQPLRRRRLSPSLMINGERFPAPLLN